MAAGVRKPYPEYNARRVIGNNKRPAARTPARRPARNKPNFTMRTVEKLCRTPEVPVAGDPVARGDIPGTGTNWK